MGLRNLLLLSTILSLLNYGQCYGPISQNPGTIAPPPSENNGLKFLGSAQDYGSANLLPSSPVASSAVSQYWWQRVQNPFVSGGCTSQNCQPSVVLRVPSSPQAKVSTASTAVAPYTGPLNLDTSPYRGCAAALKCVPDNYCTVEGIASDAPVALTKELYELRVPLTDCQDPASGIIGKCCRDPNYKDPWPSDDQEHEHTDGNAISTDYSYGGTATSYSTPESSVYISQSPSSTETVIPISAFKPPTNVPKPVGDYGSEDSNSISPYPVDTVPSYGFPPQSPEAIKPLPPPSTPPTPPNYPPQSPISSKPPYVSQTTFPPKPSYPPQSVYPQQPIYVTQTTYPTQPSYPYPSHTTIITHPPSTNYPVRPIYTYYPSSYPTYGPTQTPIGPPYKPPQSASYPGSQKPPYPPQNYPGGGYPQKPSYPGQQPYPSAPGQQPTNYPGQQPYPPVPPQQPGYPGQQPYPSPVEPPKQPSYPGQQPYPSTPQTPQKPGYPSEPSYPSSSEPPTQPSYPAQHPYPSTPQNPAYPGQPSYPSSEPPKEPGYPGQPSNPSTPVPPAQPGYPGQYPYPPHVPPSQPSYPSSPAPPSQPVYPTTVPSTSQSYPPSSIPPKQPGYPTTLPPHTEKPFTPSTVAPQKPGYPISGPIITEKPHPVSTTPPTYPSHPPQTEIPHTTSPPSPFPGYPSTGVSQTEHPHPVSSPPSSSPAYPPLGSQPSYPGVGSQQPGYPTFGSQSPSYPSGAGKPPSHPTGGSQPPSYPDSGSHPSTPPPQSQQPGVPPFQQPSYPSQGAQQPAYPPPPGFPITGPGYPGFGPHPGYPGSGQQPGYPVTGPPPGYPVNGPPPGYPATGPPTGYPGPGPFPGYPGYPGSGGSGQAPGVPPGSQQPSQPGSGHPPGYPEQPGQGGPGQAPGIPPGSQQPNQPGSGPQPGYPGPPVQGGPGQAPGYPPGSQQPNYPSPGYQPGYPGPQQPGYPYPGQGYPYPGPTYFYPYPGQPGVQVFVSEESRSTPSPIPPNTALYPLSSQQGAIIPNSQRPHVSIDPGVTPSLLLKEFTGPCGVKTNDGTAHGEAPWHAIVYSSKNKDLICGGAIVSENAILTTAHCLDHSESDSTQVKVGPQGNVHHVQAIVRHSKYDRNTYNRDLALLILKEPVEFDSHVGKICLPTSVSQMESLDRECYVSTLTKELEPKTLKSVPVQVFPYKDCESKLKNTYLGKYFVLNDSFSCGSTPTNDELCTVKTGSPIACNKGDGTYELFGLKSWDLGCQEYKKSAIFSNFDVFWVRSMLGMPTSKLIANEQAYLRAKFRGETLEGVKIEEKPGFNQGYGK